MGKFCRPQFFFICPGDADAREGRFAGPTGDVVAPRQQQEGVEEKKSRRRSASGRGGGHGSSCEVRRRLVLRSSSSSPARRPGEGSRRRGRRLRGHAGERTGAAAGRPCIRADPHAGGPVGEGERPATSSTTRGWSYSSCPPPASNPSPAREEKPVREGVVAMARARRRPSGEEREGMSVRKVVPTLTSNER
jgi:hypothetical protein